MYSILDWASSQPIWLQVIICIGSLFAFVLLLTAIFIGISNMLYSANKESTDSQADKRSFSYKAGKFLRNKFFSRNHD